MYVFIVGMSIYSQVMCMVDIDIVACDIIAHSAAHFFFFAFAVL